MQAVRDVLWLPAVVVLIILVALGVYRWLGTRHVGGFRAVTTSCTTPSTRRGRSKGRKNCRVRAARRYSGLRATRWLSRQLLPRVWHEFKNYGRGRTKALLLHTEEVIGRSAGEPREILKQLFLPKLRAQANRDIAEDFQDISTASTFAADKSLLDIAREVGLDDKYHSVMIPASSALHGDCAALEDLVLDRCVHALHDHHAIPRAEYAGESSEQFPYLADSFARWSFDEYCRAMAYQPMSGEEAEREMLSPSNV